MFITTNTTIVPTRGPIPSHTASTEQQLQVAGDAEKSGAPSQQPIPDPSTLEESNISGISVALVSGEYTNKEENEPARNSVTGEFDVEKTEIQELGEEDSQNPNIEKSARFEVPDCHKNFGKIKHSQTAPVSASYK